MLYPLSYEGWAPDVRSATGDLLTDRPARRAAGRGLPCGMPSRPVQVTRELSFAAARSLPHVLGGRTGPHRYRVVLTVGGPLDERGLVVDFAELDRLAAPVLAQLDGQDLVTMLRTPSAEVIALWLLDRLQPVVPGLVSVQVWETDRGSAVAHVD